MALSEVKIPITVGAKINNIIEHMLVINNELLIPYHDIYLILFISFAP
mgnify:CR=1 FL=1